MKINAPTEMEKLQTMTGETDPRVCMVYLDQARETILAYTGRDNLTGLESFVLDLAAYRIVKRGADYQTTHSENGVSRAWSGDMMDAPAGFWSALKKAIDNLSDSGMGWI